MSRSEFLRWLQALVVDHEPVDETQWMGARGAPDEALMVTVHGSTFIVRVEGPLAAVQAPAEIIDVLVATGQG